MSASDQVRPVENVYGVLTNHRKSCRLQQQDGLLLPEHYCDCGALSSEMAKHRFKWKNLVTDAGLIYYAQRAAAETPTNTFASAYVGTAGNAPAAASNYSDLTALATNPEQSVDATYPTTNDGDSDNGGAGTAVTTWRFSYPAANGVGTLDRIAISVATASGTDPLLMYAESSSFTPSGDITKTSSDTLKFFVNHTFQRP